MFGKKKPKVVEKYTIVELEKPVQSLEFSADIASLAEHPGFHALMARLRVQKALLESTLRTQRHEDLSDVTRLQAGISWLGYLERQVNLATSKQENNIKSRQPFELEQQELERIAQALQFVGRGKPQ